MFSVRKNKLKLLARDEGKIKSYESCLDIRAWSHDSDTRVRHLRDWIKCEMPICVIPVSTVASSLRMMSWRRRGKISPRCHPDCKSKVVLDSICNSCHAIKECFKVDDDFQKYFVEDEFETTYWPCERCLEALKSIKIFWKIILERIFKVKFPKSEDSYKSGYTDVTVKSIARMWQENIVEEALFVQSLTPFIDAQQKYRTNEDPLKDNTKQDISTDTDFIIYNTYVRRVNSASLCTKLSRCTSTRIKVTDVGCGTCVINQDEIDLYKNNLDYMQQRFNIQNDKLKQLKKKNITLQLELRDMRKNVVPSYTPILISDRHVAVAPKPFESCFDEDKIDAVKDIESEMIITLKNCKNKNFRHVSMLQVLHKTNETITKDTFSDNKCKKNEDPIHVLTKVHNTFGALVKREITIANKNKSNTNDISVDAYHRINKEKYDPISSEKLSHTTISESNFMSTTEVL